MLKSAEDTSKCFVQYSAREGAVRILAEPALNFKVSYNNSVAQ